MPQSLPHGAVALWSVRSHSGETTEVAGKLSLLLPASQRHGIVGRTTGRADDGLDPIGQHLRHVERPVAAPAKLSPEGPGWRLWRTRDDNELINRHPKRLETPSPLGSRKIRSAALETRRRMNGARDVQLVVRRSVADVDDRDRRWIVSYRPRDLEGADLTGVTGGNRVATENRGEHTETECRCAERPFESHRRDSIHSLPRNAASAMTTTTKTAQPYGTSISSGSVICPIGVAR